MGLGAPCRRRRHTSTGIYVVPDPTNTPNYTLPAERLQWDRDALIDSRRPQINDRHPGGAVRGPPGPSRVTPVPPPTLTTRLSPTTPICGTAGRRPSQRIVPCRAVLPCCDGRRAATRRLLHPLPVRAMIEAARPPPPPPPPPPRPPEPVLVRGAGRRPSGVQRGRDGGAAAAADCGRPLSPGGEPRPSPPARRLPGR